MKAVVEIFLILAETMAYRTIVFYSTTCDQETKCAGGSWLAC